MANLIKLLENVLLLGRRDADSAVADLDLHVVAATPAAHHHRSLVRIANSIGDKVAEQTMQMAKAAGYVLLHKPVSPARLRAVVTQFAWKVRKMSVPGLGDEDTSG